MPKNTHFLFGQIWFNWLLRSLFLIKVFIKLTIMRKHVSKNISFRIWEKKKNLALNLGKLILLDLTFSSYKMDIRIDISYG